MTMSNSSTEISTTTGPAAGGRTGDAASEGAGVLAIVGVVFCCLSAALYAGLVYSVWNLPSDQQQLELLRGRTSDLMRLVILGASAGLLNLVALVLCGIELLLPRRSQAIALSGAVVSLVLLLGVAAVVLLSAISQ